MQGPEGRRSTFDGRAPRGQETAGSGLPLSDGHRLDARGPGRRRVDNAGVRCDELLTPLLGGVDDVLVGGDQPDVGAVAEGVDAVGDGGLLPRQDAVLRGRW